MPNLGKVIAILGAQWGDEGKGKLVDILADEYKTIVRATGGANAGHTVYVKNEGEERKKYVFHLIPSGILYPENKVVIGNGLVVHGPTMFEEIDSLEAQGIKTEGRILLSTRAHLLFDYHKLVDAAQEEEKGGKKVGTTKRGIGPCYSDKINRTGVRVCDLFNQEMFEEKVRRNAEMYKKRYRFDYDVEGELEFYRAYREKIMSMVVDTTAYTHEEIKKGTKIMFEGANGMLLDIDHGTFPYVTSSNPHVDGLGTGTGVSVRNINSVIGIFKAYSTRVGAGPFPTELENELGDKIREQGGEFGSTTGRPRRCGWFDAVAGRYSCMLNKYDLVNLTKLDVLTGVPELRIATAYKINGKVIDTYPPSVELLDQVQVEYETFAGWDEDLSLVRRFKDLPENAQKYVKAIEDLLETPVKFIGIGQNRDQMITV